jgi:hypothetical protein
LSDTSFQVLSINQTDAFEEFDVLGDEFIPGGWQGCATGAVQERASARRHLPSVAPALDTIQLQIGECDHLYISIDQVHDHNNKEATWQTGSHPLRSLILAVGSTSQGPIPVQFD